jgi:hypothetical protein
MKSSQKKKKKKVRLMKHVTAAKFKHGLDLIGICKYVITLVSFGESVGKVSFVRLG